MVELTPRAKAVLVKLRVASGIPPRPDAGLRLAPGAGGQLELFPDTERVGDRVIEYHGSKLLLIDKDLLRDLSGAVIDCRFTSGGPKLVVNRLGGRN